MNSEQELKINQIINQINFLGGEVSDDMVEVITKVVEIGHVKDIKNSSNTVWMWNAFTKLYKSIR